MEKIIHDEKNRLDYELIGDYYYPCLKAPEELKVSRFGIFYHDYLRTHKKVTYSGLMLSGKLKEHIENVDRQAEEMFYLLVCQIKKAEGITEQLKATNQLASQTIFSYYYSPVFNAFIKSQDLTRDMSC